MSITMKVYAVPHTNDWFRADPDTLPADLLKTHIEMNGVPPSDKYIADLDGNWILNPSETELTDDEKLKATLEKLMTVFKNGDTEELTAIYNTVVAK